MENLDLAYFENHFQEVLEEAKEFLTPEEFIAAVPQGGDAADTSANDRLRSLHLKLDWRKALYLKKIVNAVERIKDGSFGDCEDCGNAIGVKRLQARPTANFCISCKEEQEKDENHMLYFKRSHTTGKELHTDADPKAFSDEEGFSQNVKIKQTLDTANQIAENAAT